MGMDGLVNKMDDNRLSPFEEKGAARD